MNKSEGVLIDLHKMLRSRLEEFYYTHSEIDHLGYIIKWLDERTKDINLNNKGGADVK